jgi:hypothetical protein
MLKQRIPTALAGTGLAVGAVAVTASAAPRANPLCWYEDDDSVDVHMLLTTAVSATLKLTLLPWPSWAPNAFVFSGMPFGA